MREIERKEKKNQEMVLFSFPEFNLIRRRMYKNVLDFKHFAYMFQNTNIYQKYKR